ncbi:MAG TPA: right-handed parallel beta-helix repeat-containing protein [Nitrososphaera sp.]|nr:right-handed parallel beta-helix repeat-containing protein [Nitrososphaera sp.]
MEPKSIAFYTAVAVSILAVLSATTIPVMAQAQDTTDEQEESSQEDNNEAVTQGDNDNQAETEQTGGEDGNSANSNGNGGAAGAASERLGLQPNSGIASCGQVVTQDVTLTSDLNCDNGDGLIVGAPGITINLNGYSITGPQGGGEASPTTADPGSEDGGETSPTTADSGRGGSITPVSATADSGSEDGGEANEEASSGEASPTTADPGSEDSDVTPASTQSRSTDYDGSSGILVANADNVAIQGLGEIAGFSRGVTFLGSSGGAVTDVQLVNNEIGVVMASSEGTEVSRNTITNNGIAVVSDSSNGGVTAFNQIVANLEQGILLLGSSDNVVAANNMYGNGESGIYLDPMSQRNHVDYNTIFGHETADLNNADGMPTNVNQNSFGDNNNCGTSLPGGLCR